MAKKGLESARKNILMGAPSNYSPELIPLVNRFAKAGLTEPQMAELMCIDTCTLWRWMKANIDFCKAVKSGGGFYDDKVERSLCERAMGYSHPSVHITNYQGDITETETIEHYPPDAASAIFWLKNRRPEKWRDKMELEITGKLDTLAKTLGQVVLSYVPESKRSECADKLAGLLNE